MRRISFANFEVVWVIQVVICAELDLWNVLKPQTLGSKSRQAWNGHFGSGHVGVPYSTQARLVRRKSHGHDHFDSLDFLVV